MSSQEVAGETPHVLRVITRLNVGGPAKQAVLLEPLLRARGFETMLAWGDASQGEGFVDPEGTRNVRVPGLVREISPVKDLKAYKNLRGELRRGRHQIVHTHTAKAGLIGRLISGPEGPPIRVHTFHGHVLEGYFPRPVNSLLSAVERGLARRSDVLVAVSPTVKSDLLSLGIGSEAQWRVIRVGLDLTPFEPARTSAARARAALGLPVEGPLVGIVGRLTAVKNLEGFLDVARSLSANHPGVSFVVAGDGESRARLERSAETTLPGKVTFTGWITDLPSLYAAVDVVVLTSLNEGTPTSLVEASAAGCPIVATRVGGVPDIVRHGETGFLARSRDMGAVAGFVGELLRSADLRDQMGLQGARWVNPRFSIERLADDLADLYCELMSLKVEPAPFGRQP